MTVFSRKIFSDINIAKKFLEDFLNTPKDFEEFKNDPTFKEIIRRLQRDNLAKDDIDYINEADEFRRLAIDYFEKQKIKDKKVLNKGIEQGIEQKKIKQEELREQEKIKQEKLRLKEIIDSAKIAKTEGLSIDLISKMFGLSIKEINKL